MLILTTESSFFEYIKRSIALLEGLGEEDQEMVESFLNKLRVAVAFPKKGMQVVISDELFTLLHRKGGMVYE